MFRLKKKLLEKIKNFFFNINESKISDQLILLGKIKTFQNINLNSDNINDYEFKVFSQFGEDGIIQYLINNLPKINKRFVEFGVENYEEANTRFLLHNNNWEGLIIDSSKLHTDFIKKRDYYWKFSINVISSFIKCENINEILKTNNFYKDIGILSIDIDGNDYWIWKSLTSIDPDIVIIEYNARFGDEKKISIPYDPEFRRDKDDTKNIYGASLCALNSLAKIKGYALVATNSNGNNAFFVRKNLLNDKVREVSVKESFNKNSFKEIFDDKLNKNEKKLDLDFLLSKKILIEIE
jgi:hypothetical protein